MNKQECLQIVELLSVTWDKPLDTQTLTIRTKGYWEYIQDLPYEQTKQTIKKLGLTHKYAPKPGELRIATLAAQHNETPPPDPEEAWATLQHISQQIYNGTSNYTKPHPALAETIKKLGGQATTLHTNSDRQMFINIYQKTIEEHIHTKYGMNNDNTT